MLLIILIGLFIVSILKISDNKKLLIITVVLLGLTIFTFGLGTDYFSYEYLYNHITLGGKANNDFVEPIFAALMQVSRMMNIDYHIFISFLRTIILLLTIKWIKDNSVKPIVSVVLYFSMFYLVWTMSAIRQGLVLAIGLNLFHSKHINLKFWNRIVIILVLSLIHYSAIFYLVYLITDKIKWNQKRHAAIIGVALISTFLPISELLSIFSFIPYVEKVILYMEPNIGFFDFASIMRLFFYAVVFYFYPVITTRKYDKRIIDNFLIGLSIYYVLKFSENAAARLTIYSFLLIIIIIPLILKYIFEKYSMKKMVIASYTALMIFSFLFFIKENHAYRDQIGYRGSNNFFEVDLINKYDYNDYDNIYSFRESQVRKSKEFMTNFSKEFEPKSCPQYDEKKTYISVQDLKSSQYGVMSNAGCWLIEPSLDTNNSIYDNVMVMNDTSQLIHTNTYLDLSNKTTQQEEMKEIVAETLKKQYLIEVEIEVLEGLGFLDVIENYSDFVPFPENISESRVVKISREDYHYYLVQFKYYSFNLNIYLDDEMKPYENIVFTNYRDYNSSDFLYATTYTGTIIFNKDGQIIWAR